MSKIKIRCSQCGKSFKSTNARQLICPECEEKARRERAAKAKGVSSPASAPMPAPRPAAPPKPTRPAASSEPKRHWLDQQADVRIGVLGPAEPARPPKLDIPERRPSPHPQAASASALGSTPRPPAQPASQPRQAAPVRQPAPGASAPAHERKGKKPDHPKRAEGEQRKSGKPAAAPSKPKREPRQPTPPFSPTPEQATSIEQRYLELAQSGEFDGIRTQISKELGIPKSAVKKVIGSLRARQNIPSWWDLQPYHGSPEDLERIRALYVPLLPDPAIGVHKEIAGQLSLPAGTVYQAIKVIRAEMNLPQYNLPQEPGTALEAQEAL
jgi:hypothetical protein